MSTYRRKPKTVEAIFYDGENDFEVGAWYRERGAESFRTYSPQYTDITFLRISFAETDWDVPPVHWFLRCIDDGEIDIWGADAFAEEYEPVPEGAA